MLESFNSNLFGVSHFQSIRCWNHSLNPIPYLLVLHQIDEKLDRCRCSSLSQNFFDLTALQIRRAPLNHLSICIPALAIESPRNEQ